MKFFLLGDEEEEIPEGRRASQIILKRLEDTTDKKIHSDFYMKLMALNEKIDLFKEVFYTKQGFFDKRTEQQQQ